MPYIGVRYQWYERVEHVAFCVLVDMLDLPYHNLLSSIPVDVYQYWGITEDPLSIGNDDRDPRRRCLDYLTRQAADHPWLKECAEGIADAFGKTCDAMDEEKSGKYAEEYYEGQFLEQMEQEIPEDLGLAVERFKKNFKGRMPANPLLREPNSEAEPEPESP